MKIEKISEEALGFIAEHEGLRLKAYLCPANVPTIGFGTTRYPNGSRIKLGDEITKDDAYKLLKHDVFKFELRIKSIARIVTWHYIPQSCTFTLRTNNL